MSAHGGGEAGCLSVGDEVWILEKLSPPWTSGKRGTVAKTLGKDRWAVAVNDEPKSRVLRSAQLRKICKDRPSLPYSIIGSWDDWQPHEMPWNVGAGCFEYPVVLERVRSASFKFIRDGDYDACVFPDRDDASPHEEHSIHGPDSGFAELSRDWTIGRHAADQATEGAGFKIQFYVADDGSPVRVAWERFDYSQAAGKQKKKKRFGWVGFSALGEKVEQGAEEAFEQDAGCLAMAPRESAPRRVGRFSALRQKVEEEVVEAKQLVENYSADSKPSRTEELAPDDEGSRLAWGLLRQRARPSESEEQDDGVRVWRGARSALGAFSKFAGGACSRRAVQPVRPLAADDQQAVDSEHREAATSSRVWRNGGRSRDVAPQLERREGGGSGGLRPKGEEGQEAQRGPSSDVAPQLERREGGGSGGARPKGEEGQEAQRADLKSSAPEIGRHPHGAGSQEAQQADLKSSAPEIGRHSHGAGSQEARQADLKSSAPEIGRHPHGAGSRERETGGVGEDAVCTVWLAQEELSSAEPADRENGGQQAAFGEAQPPDKPPAGKAPGKAPGAAPGKGKAPLGKAPPPRKAPPLGKAPPPLGKAPPLGKVPPPGKAPPLGRAPLRKDYPIKSFLKRPVGCMDIGKAKGSIVQRAPLPGNKEAKTSELEDSITVVGNQSVRLTDLSSIQDLKEKAHRRPPEREHLACSSRGCGLLAHSSPEFGGYCCRACFRSPQVQCNHDRHCQGVPLPPRPQRAARGYSDEAPMGEELQEAERKDLTFISDFLRGCTRLPAWMDTAAIGKYIHGSQKAILERERDAQLQASEHAPCQTWLRNLALGRPVTASSTENTETGSSCWPENVVDGCPNTRWSSTYTDDEWIMVDLGEEYALSRVDIRWEGAFAEHYVILGSQDGESWFQLGEEHGCEGWVSTPLLRSCARWVRVECDARATPYGYSIWELAVYPAERPDARTADTWLRLAQALLKQRRRDPQEQLRAAIFVNGSRGDFQPALALAVRLTSRGWRVRVFTTHAHHDANVELALSLRVDVQSVPTHGLCFETVKMFMPHVVLHQWSMTPLAWVLEEQLGIQAVEYAFWPTPPWTVWDRFLEIFVGKKALDRHLGVETLPQLSEAWVFEQLWHKRPVLYAFSGQVALRQGYWPAPTPTSGYHLTGYWVLDPKEQKDQLHNANRFFGGESGPRLVSFLDAGPAPVYMGWGSMTAVNEEVPHTFLAQLAVRTLMLAGRRGIILGSYKNMNAEELRSAPDAEELLRYSEENVLWMRWAPHEWLMPKCCTILHHGGCSTTATSLRSGRPTVVTPLFIDQYYWGAQVERIGAGVRTERLNTLTARDLVKALRACEAPSVQDAAASLGERLLEESGTDAVEQWLRSYLRGAEH